MGQAASYAESAIQRALLRLKTEEQKKEVDILALCGYQHPSSTASEDASPPSGTAQKNGARRKTKEEIASSKGKNTATPSSPDAIPMPTAPASWGPFVSLTPESYSIDELREALAFLPDSLWVSLNRISLLYVLDNDLDGDFGLNDIAHFTDWAIRVMPGEVSTDQLAEVIQAHAALECWHRCLVRGQQLRDRNANLVRNAGGGGHHRQHRDRGGQSSLLVALTISDDLLRMAGGATAQEVEHVAVTDSCESSSPSHLQLPPLRQLQSPVTKDDKLQASVHFARWMLRMIHAQELARRQSGEQQRHRYREARQQTQHSGAAAPQAVANGRSGVAQPAKRKSCGDVRRPSSASTGTPADPLPLSQSPSPTSPSILTAPRAGSGCADVDSALQSTSNTPHTTEQHNQGVKRVITKTLLLPPLSRQLDSPGPLQSELSPLRPGAASEDRKTQRHDSVRDHPRAPKGLIIISRKGGKKNGATSSVSRVGEVQKSPGQVHHDPRGPVGAKEGPEAVAIRQVTDEASPSTDGAADPHTSSSGESDDGGDEGAENEGVTQLTEQEELVVDALLAQDLKSYNNLHTRGWHTVGAVEEIYLDLAVHESYGLPFWAFCRKLHEQSAKEVEAALGLTSEEATRELISAVALEEARQRTALEYVRTRRCLQNADASINNFLLTIGEDDGDDDVVRTGGSRDCSRLEGAGDCTPTTVPPPQRPSPVPVRPSELPVVVPPIPSFIVSRYTLLCFLHCFIKAYWDVLENMGFDPFVAESVHATK